MLHVNIDRVADKQTRSVSGIIETREELDFCVELLDKEAFDGYGDAGDERRFYLGSEPCKYNPHKRGISVSVAVGVGSWIDIRGIPLDVELRDLARNADGDAV